MHGIITSQVVAQGQKGDGSKSSSSQDMEQGHVQEIVSNNEQTTLLSPAASGPLLQSGHTFSSYLVRSLSTPTQARWMPMWELAADHSA